MRLRADRKGTHHVTVRVYQDKPAMLAALKRANRAAGHKTEAFCASFFRKKFPNPTRWRWGCDVYLYAGGFGSGIASHELTHAAFFYVTRGRKSDALSFKRINERLAWSQGWLVHQFWRAFYRKPASVRGALRQGVKYD